MIEEGTEVPDFTLPNQDGEDVTLSDCAAARSSCTSIPKAEHAAVLKT